ncbi:MAG: hypothetical protein WED07_08830 [Candidatus Freyarchaeum deiterrae]
MDPYWFMYDPLTQSLLNIIFGIVLIVGIGLLVMNIVKLATSHQRMGPTIGLILSLLIIGLSASWQSVLPIIAQTMGGVVQYLSIYLYTLIYQWIAQHTTTTTATALLLLPLLL